MPITPKDTSRRDSEGYELDDDGNRVYPPWAAYIPPGAKTSGSKRPPWVPSIANYWDETQPPAGWFKLANGDWKEADQEVVAAAPEAPDAKPTGIRCQVCEKTFDTAHGLLVHMAHHRKENAEKAA